MPILYSFRRCPYAIRARMALVYAGIEFELREVLLRNKPPEMIQASSKATVPVFVLDSGRVIDESYDVMRWALEQQDPGHWWQAEQSEMIDSLIQANDFEFKPQLDRYKYADRYPQHPREYYRDQAGGFLATLENLLLDQPFLLGADPGFADIAIFPFIRQFAMSDKAWWNQQGPANLKTWLQHFLDSSLFLQVMKKQPLWVSNAL